MLGNGTSIKVSISRNVSKWLAEQREKLDIPISQIVLNMIYSQMDKDEDLSENKLTRYKQEVLGLTTINERLLDENMFYQKNMKKIIETLPLTDKQRQIILKYCVCHNTYQEIGDTLGVSRQRVEQIINGALKRIAKENSNDR